MSKTRVFLEMASGHRFKMVEYEKEKSLSFDINSHYKEKDLLFRFKSEWGGTQSINILNIERVYEVTTNN